MRVPFLTLPAMHAGLGSKQNHIIRVEVGCVNDSLRHRNHFQSTKICENTSPAANTVSIQQNCLTSRRILP